MADRLDNSDPIDTLILERMAAFTSDGSGYLAIQQTRPQTIGYALADSPVFQLAWIAEKFHDWTDVAIDRDLVLTHASIYWFNRAGGVPRTCSTTRRTPPTGAHRHRCRTGSRCSAPTRRSESSCLRPKMRSGSSTSGACTSRRWRYGKVTSDIRRSSVGPHSGIGNARPAAAFVPGPLSQSCTPHSCRC